MKSDNHPCIVIFNLNPTGPDTKLIVGLGSLSKVDPPWLVPLSRKYYAFQ